MNEIKTEIRDKAAASYDRALAKKNLHEAMSARLLLGHAGGLWRCDHNLISLLESYKSEPTIALLDCQDVPHVVDPAQLLPLVKQRHQEIMNDWLIAYNDLAKIRTARHV